MVDAHRPPPDDEFYIGYRRTPSGQARFLRRATAVVVTTGVAVALIAAVAQRDPGNGTWHRDSPIKYSGQIELKPYPVLRPREERADGGHYLIVDQGKRGGAERLEGLDRHDAQLTAHMLERDGLRLLELADTPESVAVTASIAVPARARTMERIERVTLSGEIIDPKCYAGAMKPGDGKTHKACAILCLRGGVPPMLLVEDSQRIDRTILLVDESGDAFIDQALEELIPFVGDRVVVSGTTVNGDGPTTLRINPRAIQRVSRDTP